MKYIAILLMISLFSCKKSTDAPVYVAPKKCYHCNLTVITFPDIVEFDTCIDMNIGIDQVKIKGVIGPYMITYCKRTN